MKTKQDWECGWTEQTKDTRHGKTNNNLKNRIHNGQTLIKRLGVTAKVAGITNYFKQLV